MMAWQHQGIRLYGFEKLFKYEGIRHFVTAREGGFSKPPYNGLNLGLHVGDDPQDVIKNRELLASTLGAVLGNFVFANQTHSAHVALVEAGHRGCGATEAGTAISDTDALITREQNMWLCVQVADCVPILLYDPVQQVVAAVHAGWKGIVKKIALAAVHTMIHHCGSRPENILAGLGPANGPCCYEIGEEVMQQIVALEELSQGSITPGNKFGKYFFDQWRAVTLQLLGSGLDANHIEQSRLCTQCLHKTFFSSRADLGTTGRFAAGIMLRQPQSRASEIL